MGLGLAAVIGEGCDKGIDRDGTAELVAGGGRYQTVGVGARADQVVAERSDFHVVRAAIDRRAGRRDIPGHDRVEQVQVARVVGYLACGNAAAGARPVGITVRPVVNKRRAVQRNGTKREAYAAARIHRLVAADGAVDRG